MNSFHLSPGSPDPRVHWPLPSSPLLANLYWFTLGLRLRRFIPGSSGDYTASREKKTWSCAWLLPFCLSAAPLPWRIMDGTRFVFATPPPFGSDQYSIVIGLPKQKSSWILLRLRALTEQNKKIWKQDANCQLLDSSSCVSPDGCNLVAFCTFFSLRRYYIQLLRLLRRHFTWSRSRAIFQEQSDALWMSKPNQCVNAPSLTFYRSGAFERGSTYGLAKFDSSKKSKD